MHQRPMSHFKDYVLDLCQFLESVSMFSSLPTNFWVTAGRWPDSNHQFMRKNSKQEILKMNGDVPKMFDQRGVPHPGQNGKARVPSTAQPELCALKGAKIYRSTLCPDPTLLCVLCEVEPRGGK